MVSFVESQAVTKPKYHLPRWLLDLIITMKMEAKFSIETSPYVHRTAQLYFLENLDLCQNTSYRF
jgi:hypothetical protein